MKKILFAVMMVVILAATGLALAQGSGKGHGMDMGYGSHAGGDHGRWAGLNLAPGQIEKMKALRKSYFEQAIPLRNELMSKKFELKALWVKTNPDEEKILTKQKEINALKAQLQEKRTKNRLEMRKILTPEQQAQMINLLSQHKGRHGYGMGHEFAPCCCDPHQQHHRHHHSEG